MYQSMLTTRSMFVAVALLLTITGISGAQVEGRECGNIVEQLRDGERRVAAMARVSLCPMTGPAALATLWKEATTSSKTERHALVEATANLKDGRLFSAAANVATDGGRSVADRISALQVLMRYYDTRYAPSFEALTSPHAERNVSLRIGGPRTVDGSVPVPATANRQIGELFAQLASSAEGNATVREAARVLRERLAHDDPENTPLADGAITLVAGCGERVTLQSTADVALSIKLEVLGTAFSRRYGIRAGTKEKPAALLLSLPKGTIVASYGGRELARLTERNASCPPGIVP